MEKKATSINIDNHKSEDKKPSVFDRIIQEVDAIEVPTIYIDHIVVQYNDGNTVELRGNEITHPIPVNKNASVEQLEAFFKQMKDVKVFVNIAKLEEDINKKLEELLGDYC